MSDDDKARDRRGTIGRVRAAEGQRCSDRLLARLQLNSHHPSLHGDEVGRFPVSVACIPNVPQVGPQDELALISI
jgi:hypothetical protein